MVPMNLYFYEVPRTSILMHMEFKVDSMKTGSLFQETIILLLTDWEHMNPRGNALSFDPARMHWFDITRSHHFILSHTICKFNNRE
jgi:hypothetical protein